MSGNKNFKSCWMLAAALLLAGRASQAAIKQESFQTSRGFNVVCKADSSMAFIHAQLAIFYKDKFTNPAVPALTLLNLFDRTLNAPDSSPILETLTKLGNDFQVEQTPDFIILKINFLSDRLPVYIHLLKLLFGNSPFSVSGVNPESYAYQRRLADMEKNFNRSVGQYWRIFFNRPDWKREIAFQIGYSKLFPNSAQGNTLVTAAALKKTTLSDLRKFYQRAFRLPNSLAVIKGDFKIPMVRAYLNSEFANFKPQAPEVLAEEKNIINPKREIIVFHSNDNDLPVLFWFEAADPMMHENYFPRLMVNKVLFGFPFGRVVGVMKEEIGTTQEIQSELTNHQVVSVICNSMEIRHRDIEPFIRTSDRERRKLSIKKIERMEFLNLLTYFNGKIKVSSQYYDSDIGHEILSQFYSFEETDYIEPARKSLEATLAGLNRRIDTSRIHEPPSAGVIVIVGNYDAIRRYLKDIHPEVYNIR